MRYNGHQCQENCDVDHVVYGLFGPKRSIGIALIALAVAVLAAGGAWYAWAESHDMPWTIGYIVPVVISIAAAARQFVGRIRPDQHLAERDER